MGMKIEQTFVINAPPDAVWAFLTDPERVAATLPGAELTEKVDETTFKGKITVRVGPVAPSFRGTVRFENLDEENRTAEITASGRGLGGVGNAEMRMVGKVKPLDGGDSEVTVSSEAKISGLLVQFGGRMIQDVSNKMVTEFAENMRSELES